MKYYFKFDGSVKETFSRDIYLFIYIEYFVLLPGSSVGISTDHGLDGPGSNPFGDEIYHPSRPTLGPTQPPAQWVPVLSRGYSAARACC